MLTRSLSTQEFTTWYDPTQNEIQLQPRNGSSPSSILYVELGLNGTPLEARVQKLAADGYQPTLETGAIDSVECRLLSWEFPKSDMAMKIWVVPSKGYLITRHQQFVKGKLVTQRDLHLRAFGDVYCFESVQEKSWRTDGAIVESYTRTIKSLDLNPKIDASVFTLDGLGIREGMLVRDRREDPAIEYIYSAPATKP
jgi:hypothetical protein